ncbi:HEAT repeat domain-containing protein [Lujinxingia vulgaris]|uniref:HEAT repeat domain-containing protein n=1 Tax=Lujinxingia vulgaris TaxID=2600176 RepID=A0A5C6X979_9DELT|nr:HEAT repeat domain-containing protein [Lujinxingia vulgaris]TXD37918.1 HEAT repeat domain-containing protein [Lujinxingia vulgaris]
MQCSKRWTRRSFESSFTNVSPGFMIGFGLGPMPEHGAAEDLVPIDQNMPNQLAAPGTLLGQLQRGHGRGYVNALRDTEAPELLLHCVEHDPRWDQQLEHRAAYYARLAMALQVEPAAIVSIYEKQSSRDDGEKRPLAAKVLAELAVRGNLEAHAQISRLMMGPHWEGVFNELSFREGFYKRPVLTGDEVLRLVRRIDDEALMSVVEFDGSERFQAWPDVIQRIHRIRRDRYADEGLRRRVEPYIMPKTSMSTETLLRQVTRQTAPKTVKILAARRDPASVALVEQAAQSEDVELAIAALQILGRQGNTAALQCVCEALENDPGTPDRPGARRRIANLRYLEALPSEVTLALAREWLRRGGARSIAAEKLIGMHATCAEREMVEEALDAALEEGAVYRAYNMIEALGVIAAPDSEELLRRAFYELPYSRARSEVLKSLKASGSVVGTLLAEESLWDSEDEARRLAITMVRGDEPGMVARIREMAHDPFEEDRICEGASRWVRDFDGEVS